MRIACKHPCVMISAALFQDIPWTEWPSVHVEKMVFNVFEKAY